MSTSKPLVNAWTEWGSLEEVVVGRADNSMYNHPEPNYHMPFGDESLDELFVYASGREAILC
jgi:hypothetical protein